MLGIIRREQVISQADVAQQTGLMASSVFSIFNGLLEQGLIREAPESEWPPRDMRGRRPKYFKLEPRAHYAFGVDLTPHYFHISLVDFAGDTVDNRQVDIVDSIDPQTLYDVITDAAFDMARKKRVPRKKVLGLGMGIPGQVDNPAGICLSSPFFKGLANLPVADELSESLKFPVCIHNNCSVIAVSERHYRQNLQQYESLLTVLVRTGVGGGFTEKNTPDSFNQVSAYEIGHIPYSLDGEICHCGARGCIEALLGEDKLVRDLNRIAPLNSVPDIDENYLEKPGVRELLDDRGRLLYSALRSVYQAVFPDIILLISRSPALSDFYSGILVREAGIDGLTRFRVISDSYDPVLYSRGAADLVWENFFT